MKIFITWSLILLNFFVLSSCSIDHPENYFGTSNSIIWKDVPADEGESVQIVVSDFTTRTILGTTVKDGVALFDEGVGRQLGGACFRFVLGRGANQRSTDAYFNPATKRASEISPQIPRLAREIRRKAPEYNDAISWKRLNTSAYLGGQCVRPSEPSYELPSNACEPRSSRVIAKNRCAAAFASCLAVSEVSASLAGRGAGALAGQICGAAMAREIGADYDVSDLFLGLLLDVSVSQLRSAFEENDDLSSGFWATSAGAIALIEFNKCTNEVEDRCSAQYLDWKTEPERVLEKCNAVEATLRGVDRAATERALLAALREESARLDLGEPKPLIQCED